MGTFILLYKGANTDMASMTPEAVQAEMAKWQAWGSGLGDALVDWGAPFGEGASVVDDASSGSPVNLTGYTVVRAADLDAAREMCADHPFLAEGKGDFAVDVFALIDMQAA